jgi:GAF domain-containing protein
MATRGRKPAERKTAPERTRSIRKPKSLGPKSVQPKSVQSKSGLSKSGLSTSAPPKPGKRVSGKSKSETVRLKSRLRIAQDRQIASAEILRTIGNVSGDAERSLHEIAETTKRLFEASSVSIFVAEGDKWAQTIHDGPSSKRIGAEVPVDQLRIGSHSLPGAAFSENRQIHLPDLNHVDPAIADWPGVRPARAAGSRTISGTPLRRAGQAIGVLIVHRDRLAPFADDELALLQSFADQAAIAIHNARLFNETKEALERQTATADILKVIASSPSDVQPVFEAIASSANRLIGGLSTAVYSLIDEMQHLSAFTPINPAADAALQALFPRPSSMQPWPEQTRNGEIVHVPDIEADPAVPEKWRDVWRMRGFRGFVRVPLRRDRVTVGMITVTRAEPGPFSAHHVQLLQTFADQAVIAIQNARMFNEVQAKTRDLTEALTYQTGTSNILSVIASSPTDVGPVLKAIVESACELCDAHDALVRLREGDDLCHGAHHGPIPVGFERRPLNRDFITSRSVIDKVTIHVHDVLSAEGDEFPEAQRMSRGLGTRTFLSVPLLRENESIGAIALRRTEVNPFSEKQIALLQTFADQAVIALGNVRLFDEVQAKTRDLTEALEQQTAISDVLRVISSSPGDVGPVFASVAEHAARICEAQIVDILIIVDDKLQYAAEFGEFGRLQPGETAPLNRDSVMGRSICDKQPVHVVDLQSMDHDFPLGREYALALGHRTTLAVPLIREDCALGTILVRRTEVRPFDDRHVALLKTFADQAAIAIENARLINETQEALERQTATADILNVIASSPDDVQPVFEAIAERSNELIRGFSTSVFSIVDEMMHLSAFTRTNPAADEALKARFPSPLSARTWGEQIRNGHIVQIPDTEVEGAVSTDLRDSARMRGYRSMLNVPLLRERTTIGLISVTRAEPGPFPSNHVQLLQTFADQAVIAIGNVQLFDEVQAKTRELAARNSAYSEQIDHQSATIDILKAMSASQGDAQPVFDVIVRRARQICNTDLAVVLEFDGTLVHLRSIHVDETSTPPRIVEAYRGIFPQPPSRASVALRAIYYGQIIHIPNMAEDADLSQASRDIGRKGAVAIPLMRDGEVIGSIGLSAKVTGGFSEAQIELLKTFAEQAVIAIRSAETFRELNTRTRDLTESLEQQTATSEVLQVISTSPGELEPVFRIMLENATRVCGANFGMMQLWNGEAFSTTAAYNVPPAFAALREGKPIHIHHPQSGLSNVLKSRQVVHIHDVTKGAAYLGGDPNVVQLADIGGARTVVLVPMLKEDEFIGTFTIYRREVQPFTDKQIALVENFTKQAVIAIENTRLLKELRERTDDLSTSLNELRAAQDRLVQTEKLASLGQLTAGIAHEIKNPLNFVNNFSALSAELTDELNDALKPVALDNQVRKEVDELTGMLKDNLEKVVQHGKRADSIVKNMLLHSRESSGERRPADVNALLDESLNLAYHGARAEKSGFNITLQRDFDADAGEVELFPQEITRAFLNLISNGFYAATKRKAENGDANFEPVLAAATRNLGDSVEIRIRDNGTGIPAEVREKMFNPFFTTKPAGEGTGLGLSMSHDIIVKQHGGSIDIETEAGEFTELRIILPRGGQR